MSIEVGKKLAKKKLIILGSMVLAIIMVIVTILSLTSNFKKINKILDPELARAMTYEQVQEGDEKIQIENADGEVVDFDYVQFDAFFLKDLDKDGEAEGVRGTCKEIGTSDTLYMELNVLTNGYLKNGKITINGDKNYYLETAIVRDTEIKDNYISKDIKQIEFKDIKNGTQKLLTAIVKSGDYSRSKERAAALEKNINKYSQINSITFTGIHVKENPDGTTQETPIRKEINFNVDWYGDVNCKIVALEQNRTLSDKIDEQNDQIKLKVSANLSETIQKLELKTSQIQAEIPKLNGYSPISVKVISENPEDANNVEYGYNEQTGILTARSEGSLSEKGKVISYPKNEYEIEVIYPLESYKKLGADSIEYKVPIEAYYEAYNNPNSEFKNPIKSNIAKDIVVVKFRNPIGSVAIFDVSVGEYRQKPNYAYIVSKKKPLNIYNGISSEEKDDTYIVTWKGVTGLSGQSSRMVMKETSDDQIVSDQFIKSDSSEESMEEVSSFIGIYFSNPRGLLGENGEIKIYDDETDELLATFDQSNWNKYTKTNPYKYKIPVKHIRVETSEVNQNSEIKVYNIKEIDDTKLTNRYTQQEFKELKKVKSTLVGYVGEIYINTDIENASYEAPISVVQLDIQQTAISTQETQKNYKIGIQTIVVENSNHEKWKNGIFLLKLPQDIIQIEINDISIDNNKVKITGYEQYEENGERFIKINTENEIEGTYTITIDCDITSDPRIPTKVENIELYSYNEKNPNYAYSEEDKYDINNNLNRSEYIGKVIENISLVSPNSLVTSQTANNYDEKGSITVAPQIAIVSKAQRKATININVTNNYSGTISEMKILGKIPFTGNTYVINKNDMGSNFNTTMTDKGIILPKELQEVAKVYYTSNENPNNDLNDETNGWTSAPENFAQVKSYLVDLGDKILKREEKHEISYEINIPEGLNYNQISNSHHAVYFSLDTAEGKYRTKTEPNKLGLKIAKQYDLELTKYQIGTEKLIPGATYSIQEDGEKEIKTRVTKEDGKLILKNLYVEKAYTIKETKSPEEYQLNKEEIKFIVNEENGIIQVQKINGNVRSIIAEQATQQEPYKVKIEVEDEVKAGIRIIKQDKETQNRLSRIKYKLTGKGINDRILTTNMSGETSIKGLEIGEIYTLEEIKATGYYLASPIKFIINNHDGEYTAKIIEGTVKTNTTIKENEVPIVNLTMENEKIPTYNLIIKKVEKGNEEKLLSGAKFKLIKDGKELGRYETGKVGTTDQIGENGIVSIPDLCAFEESRQIDQTYILQETFAPEGYAKLKDIKFIVTKNEDGTFSLSNTQGTIANTQIEGNNVTITLADTPSFELTKTDAETGELLPNTKFVIYNVDDTEIPARNSKGELIGTKEVIDGKEYNVVTTDANGKITSDLPEGLYKAVEVKTSHEKYKLANAVYFGIGAFREPSTKKMAHLENAYIMEDSFYSAATTTNDGGYVLVGEFVPSKIQVEGYFEDPDTSTKMLIKYDNNEEIEWAAKIDINNINDITQIADGGYIIGGYFVGDIQIGEENLSSQEYTRGILIKYSNIGNIEWVTTIGGETNYSAEVESVVATKDGGYIVGGDFSGDIQIDSDTVTNINGSGIIKYDSNRKVEWVSSIQAKGSSVKSIIQTNEQGYIVGYHIEYTYGSDGARAEAIVEGKTYNESTLIIKYNKDGKIEWINPMKGNMTINSMSETNDGGFILAGSYEYREDIQLGNYILPKAVGYSNGMIIKCNNKGNVEWATGIDDQLASIYTVSSTKDGGFIIGGIFKNEYTNIGGYVLENKGGEYMGMPFQCGMIVKYEPTQTEEKYKVKWAVSIGGWRVEQDMKKVMETNKGKYIIISYKNSSYDSSTIGDYILEGERSYNNKISR